MKKILSLATAIIIGISSIQLVTVMSLSATASVIVIGDRILFSLPRGGNVTSEQLAEMIASGKIPPNATELSLTDNQISDLTPLVNLSNLQRLNLSGNRISDLTPLTELTSLEALFIGGNQISDISPLAELINLQDLALSHNQISDISPLAELTNLGTTFGGSLELSNNQITDITPLANLTNLQTLGLQSNQITDVTPLQGMTNLWLLDLRNNQIEDVMPLSWLTKMDGDTTARLLRGNPVFHDTEQLASLAEARARNTTRTTLTLGHVLGTRDYTVHDAIEILRFCVGLPSVLDSDCAVTIMAALIVSEEVPDVQDAIAILRHLLELPSALDSG